MERSLIVHKLGNLQTLAITSLLLLAACTSTPPSVDHNVTTPGTTAASSAATGSSAPQPVDILAQTALRTLIAQQDRLYRVAAPLLTANAALCTNNARNLLGFTAKNKYSYSNELVSAAESIGLDNRLRISQVLPGSGAALNGVQTGDIIVAIAGQVAPQGPDAERQTAKLLTPLVQQQAPIKLTLMHDRTTKNVTVPLTLACAFSIELGNADNVNSYADGRRILITRGMLGFVKSDEELAYLIAKEIAHNSLDHPTKQRMVTTTSGVIDNLLRISPNPIGIAGTAGIRPYPQDLDAAADTLSLYMLARAGYNLDGEPAFWQRLATQYPASILNGYTALHPSTDYRLAMIGKVTQIIKAKQAAGAPLIP